MLRIFQRIAFISVICCALTVLVFAQQNSSGSTANGKQLSSQDQQFLQQLAKGSEGEVEISRMVASKTSNQQVKEFAERMVHDHSNLDQQLRQIASKHGMSMPQPMNSEQQQLQSKLQGMSGAELDRAYMAAQVKDHEQDVQKLSAEAQHANQMQPSDPDVAQLAQEALPVIQQHLQFAKQVAAQVGATGQK